MYLKEISERTQQPQRCIKINHKNVKCITSNRWSSWGDYGACSVSCGGGAKFRSRTKEVTASCGGLECDGSNEEVSLCNDKCCAGLFWSIKTKIKFLYLYSTKNKQKFYLKFQWFFLLKKNYGI